MRLRLTYGWFVSLLVVGTIFGLWLIAQLSSVELAPITLGSFVIAVSLCVWLLPFRLVCPVCLHPGAARLTYGYSEKLRTHRNSAVKLDCENCGMLVCVSDIPPRFERDD